MRAWPKIASALLLALPLAALLIPPAIAAVQSTVATTRTTVTTGNTVTRTTVRTVTVPTVTSSSFFPLTNGVLFPTNITFGNQFSGFGSTTGFVQPGVGWWDASLFGWSGPYVDQSQPPRIIVIAAPRQPAGPPPEPAKVTVETTPSGVQVVRGPGSRHLYRY
jgi:hypothetical protein